MTDLNAEGVVTIHNSYNNPDICLFYSPLELERWDMNKKEGEIILTLLTDGESNHTCLCRESLMKLCCV